MGMYPKTIDDFVKSRFKSYLKVYLVLKYKGFSWKKELENDFSIETSVVSLTLKILETDGYIISKNFYDLDLDFQEIIQRTNGSYFDKINSFPKVYVLNEDETRIQWYELFKDDIKLLILGDGSMTHTLKLAKQKKKSQNQVKKEQIERNKNSLTQIRKDYKNNILFEIQTPLGKEREIYFEQAKQELKKLRLESKKNLSETEIKQLEYLNQKGTAIIAKKVCSQLSLNTLKINFQKLSQSKFSEKEEEIIRYNKQSKKFEKEREEEFKKIDKDFKNYYKNIKHYHKDNEKNNKILLDLENQYSKIKFSKKDKELLDTLVKKDTDGIISFSENDKLIFLKNRKEEDEIFKKKIKDLSSKMYNASRILVNQPQIEGIGKPINNIDNDVNNRATSLFKELGIFETKEKIQKINPKFKILRNELEKYGSIDIYRSLDYLGSKEEWFKFQNTIKDLKLKSIDDDLVLIKLT